MVRKKKLINDVDRKIFKIWTYHNPFKICNIKMSSLQKLKTFQHYLNYQKINTQYSIIFLTIIIHFNIHIKSHLKLKKNWIKKIFFLIHFTDLPRSSTKDYKMLIWRVNCSSFIIFYYFFIGFSMKRNDNNSFQKCFYWKCFSFFGGRDSGDSKSWDLGWIFG